MKRKWKALASVCLALALMLCLSLPVWADPLTESSTGNIIVENAEVGSTVYVYRLMTVKVDATTGQPKAPVYTWVDSVAEWLKDEANGYDHYISSEANDNSVTNQFTMPGESDGSAKQDIAEFYDALAAAIRKGDIRFEEENIKSKDVTSTVPEATTATCTISDLPMGNYLVLIEDGMKVYRPSAVNLVPVWEAGTGDTSGQWILRDATVEVKSSDPTITKTVSDPQVHIGETVTYTLEADVPNFPDKALNKKYMISDILPAGMELTGNISVYGYTAGQNTASNGDSLAEDAHYTKSNSRTTVDPASTSTSFTLTFNYDTLKNNGEARYVKIKVVYQATANEDIKVIGQAGNSEGNKNTAYLDYSKDLYATTATWQTKTATATVYTYGIDVTKRNGDDTSNTPKETLSGAEFTLRPANSNGDYDDVGTDIHFEKDEDGVYHRAAAQSGDNTKITVDENGKLTINGLDVGTYYLTETKAPDGYVILKDPIKIIIEDNGILNNQDNKAPNGKTEFTNEEQVEQENASGYVSLEVLNYHGFSLPTTGGMGTVLFTAAGIALMGVGLAALVLFLRRRSDK